MNKKHCQGFLQRAFYVDIILKYNYNIIMKSISFEWDKKKATSNLEKHGISFEEAKTAFWDPNARIIHDPDHSEDEDRFILLGLSEAMNILLVCHCYKESDETIRIISARKASKKEANNYGGYL